MNPIITKKEITTAIFSQKENKVLKALDIIKKNGDAELFNIILELLNIEENEKIRDKIIDIINNVKLQDVVPVIISAIKEIRFSKSLYILLTSCWMSGLEYEKYIDVFTDIFIISDFLTAFEAFTVIENMDNEKIPSDILEKSYKKLSSEKENIENDKKRISDELINIFEDLIKSKKFDK